jgi:glycosyltransferase involved in cell wall biosynthesis
MRVLKKINQIKKTVVSTNLPNIYLLHGEFTDIEMNQLYNHPKVKAMVNLTKGEGYGRPLLEFSLTKKPVIASGWSGHIDFLNSEFTTLLPGQLTNVHESAVVPNMILKESQWFSVDHGAIGHSLKEVYENYKPYKEKANRQAYLSKTNFSWDKMKDKIDELCTQYIPDLPKKVEIKLPTLKKIELPKKPVLNG